MFFYLVSILLSATGCIPVLYALDSKINNGNSIPISLGTNAQFEQMNKDYSDKQILQYEFNTQNFTGNTIYNSMAWVCGSKSPKEAFGLFIYVLKFWNIDPIPLIEKLLNLGVITTTASFTLDLSNLGYDVIEKARQCCADILEKFGMFQKASTHNNWIGNYNITQPIVQQNNHTSKKIPEQSQIYRPIPIDSEVQ